ncbi:lycopene cyclase domain-containing protein [Candidatus Micrarchaeota archaeon]|nr:lycopene cyclase domain-containing protein [Candidatus Micrarchaeota archaeon]
MGAAYFSYLLAVLLGTLALCFFFRIRIPVRRALTAVFPAALLFVAWDAWAVFRGHWTFNPDAVLGIFIGNQPLEEIAFFFVIPFFYITVWEIAKAKVK